MILPGRPAVLVGAGLEPPRDPGARGGRAPPAGPRFTPRGPPPHGTAVRRTPVA